MISKGKIAGLLALCSIATLTCGFSAWIVGGETTGPGVDFSVNGKVGDIKDFRNSFVFNENEMTIDKPNAQMTTTMFSYNNYGIVQNDVVTGTVGEFSFYMAVFLKGDKGLFSDDVILSSFSFQYGFKDTGSFLLLNYLQSVTSKISNGSLSSVISDKALVRTAEGVNTSVTCTNSDLLKCNRLFYYTTLTFDFSKNYGSNESVTFSTIVDQLPDSGISIMVNYND